MTDQSSEDGLPPGWTVEVKVRKDGRRDKYYFAPSSGLKFDSRAKVFRYLNIPDVRNPGPGQKIKGTRKRSEKKVLVEKAVAEGLPPGWIKEVRVTNKGRKTRRDSLYTDPVSGHTFRSLKAVSRYLETGELERHAHKPNDTDIVGVELEDDDISSAAVAKKQKPEPSSTEDQKICDQSPKLDEKVVDDKAIAEGLPPGWIKEVRVTKKGRKTRRDAFYTDPVSGHIFRSLKAVSRYLETGESERRPHKPKDMGIVGVELEDDISLPAFAKIPEPSCTEEQKIRDLSPKLDEKVKYDEILKSVLSECNSDQSGGRLDTDFSGSHLF